MRSLRQAARASLAVLAWACTTPAAAVVSDLALHDAARDRTIPLVFFEPATEACAVRCPVLIFGTGYRTVPADYAFLLQALARSGHFVVALQHDLPTDERMPDTGDVVRDRTPHWERGVASIRYVVRVLSRRLTSLDWSAVTLAGHSNGGDIAALYAARHAQEVRALVTLDHRRVPLPAAAAYPVLSLRSADQPADPGVLPAVVHGAERAPCVVSLQDTRHDDMNEAASPAAKQAMVDVVTRFLAAGTCPGRR